MALSKTAVAALACVALLGTFAPIALARPVKPPQLNDELVQEVVAGREFVPAIWVAPNVFLDKMPQKEAERFSKSIEGYSIFVVLDGEIGATGSLTAKSQKELLAGMSLKVGSETFAPLEDSAVPVDLKVLGERLKPMMQSLAGNVGQHMEFVFFADADANGRTLLRQDLAGDASLSLSGHIFTWHVPLESLLPAMVDRENGDTFPGDYIFSPFSGRKLVLKE